MTSPRTVLPNMGRFAGAAVKLEDIQIATPCPASWAAMRGDDRVRFCSLCRLSVYDVAAMSREDAEALVHGAEGRLCIRLYRRADGTVITQDCPVGLAARARRAARHLIAGAAAMLIGIFGASVSLGRAGEGSPFGAVARWLGYEPQPPTPPRGEVVGELILPSPRRVGKQMVGPASVESPDRDE